MSDSARVADVVAGHRRVVLISGRDPNRLDQHTAVIKAATKAQVEHVYYTSGLRAHDVRFEIGADHTATEDALISSGVTYTILRNGWYIENYIQAMAGPRYTGILAAAVGDAVIAPASRRDLADALAAVVMTDGHDNVTYNLSGDTELHLRRHRAGHVHRPGARSLLHPGHPRRTTLDAGGLRDG